MKKIYKNTIVCPNLKNAYFTKRRVYSEDMKYFRARVVRAV